MVVQHDRHPPAREQPPEEQRRSGVPHRVPAQQVDPAAAQQPHDVGREHERREDPVQAQAVAQDGDPHAWRVAAARGGVARRGEVGAPRVVAREAELEVDAMVRETGEQLALVHLAADGRVGPQRVVVRPTGSQPRHAGSV